ncbi:MAG: hypothetical protein M3O50_01975 [Myxococcota bacterium]|nr:hypothetical protein [Myxococcota bacterium]
MALFLRAGHLLLGAAAVAAAMPSCYSAGAGTAPPPRSFYFPVGLAVSYDGKWLYAVNSDFDLQWNGGTLQSYDLTTLRSDASALIASNLAGGNAPPALQLLGPAPGASCVSTPTPGTPLGQSCAPPVDSRAYFHDSAVIGAFAIDLQLSVSTLDGTPSGRRRLFVPVRGDATLTWADLNDDGTIDCGARVDGRCNPSHHAGNNPNEAHNSRNVTLPGEPFGMAQTEDGTAIAITHQTDTKASLFTSGVPAAGQPFATEVPPAMQFVLDGLPTGGNGIAAVPHDPDAVNTNCQSASGAIDSAPCVRPAFLETSHDAAQLVLLRYYSDDGSTLHRPFLAPETFYPLTANAGGTDSRGIVIDPTPRLLCKRRVGGAGAAALRACGRLPARVFFASRTPPALVVGEIGESSVSGAAQGGAAPASDGAPYDPDQLVITKNIPLPNGPSRVYLAPIVDASGNYAIRVFIVCFESSQVVVYDPDAQAVENIINVGQGPFAMAFDPFQLADILPPETPRDPSAARLAYRFAYVASFTQSYVQMIDLNQNASPSTFESVVFTLGQPTKPKGQ